MNFSTIVPQGLSLMNSSTILILFDGECAFCSGWVRFLADKDAHRRFRFLSLQSPSAASLLQAQHIPATVDSIVVWSESRLLIESEAVLRIAKELAFPWKLVLAAHIIPSKIRNALYRWVARHRHSLSNFGASCVIDDPAVRSRLINDVSELSH